MLMTSFRRFFYYNGHLFTMLDLNFFHIFYHFSEEIIYLARQISINLDTDANRKTMTVIICEKNFFLFLSRAGICYAHVLMLNVDHQLTVHHGPGLCSGQTPSRGYCCCVPLNALCSSTTTLGFYTFTLILILL